MPIRLFILLLVFSLSAPAAADDAVPSAHDFAFTAIEGDPLPLSEFEGQVLLVVNTASRCGYTHQYAALQDLWARYRDRGLVVLAVPSNDFGRQEPGTEQEIKTFCEVNFNVDFPMTTKNRVTGAAAHPFYRWAVAQTGPEGAPRWNFHKLLIDAEGQLSAWFSTPTPPNSAEVTGAIERLLPQPAADG